MPTPAYVRHLHVGSPEFATVGTWTNASADTSGVTNYGPNQLYKSGSGGLAYWALFDLPTGPYKVYLTWNSRQPETSGDGDASATVGVSVDVGDGAPYSSTIDQRHVPVPAPGYPDYRDALGGEAGWVYVGQYFVTDQTMMVTVSSVDSGKAWADGLRIVAADADLDGRCKTPARFQDDFQDGVASPSWEHSGGTWSETGGLYRQTATGVAARKARQVYQEWSKTHCEALARVRVDSWTASNALSRAGVALNLNASGLGYALCFDGRGASQDSIGLVDDSSGWTASASFAWSTGTWYWFRLRREGSTLRGRVWADGSSEPSTWQCETTIGGAFFDRALGYPGLVAHVPTSFDDASFGQFDAATACATPSRTHPALASSGSVSSAGARSGSASPSRTHPGLAASGGSTPPSYGGTAVLDRHPSLAAAGPGGPPEAAVDFWHWYRGIPAPADRLGLPRVADGAGTASGSAAPDRAHASLSASGSAAGPAAAAGSASLPRNPLLLSSGNFGDTLSGSASPARTPPAVAASGTSAAAVAAPRSGSLIERRLLARWKFDEPSGRVFADSSGNGRTATASASVAHATGGPQGLTIDVGGTGIAFAPATLGDRWTLSLWMRPSTLASGTLRPILASGDSGVFLGADERIRVADGPSHSASGTTALNPFVPTWRHVAVAYDQGEARIYVDGTLEYEGTGWAMGGLAPSSLFSAASPYYGGLDDARIYADALDDADVALVGALGLDGVRRIPHALAASGSASPPSFGGSLSRTTTPRTMTSAATDGQMHGSAAVKAPRRTLANLGVYRYVLKGAASATPRPLIFAEGTGFMPGLLPLRISGSDGWNVLGRASAAITGHESLDGSVTLAMRASSPPNEGVAPLYVRSSGVASTPASGLPLAIVGASPAPITRTATLAIHAASEHGSFRAAPAFIRGSTGRATGLVNLALHGGVDGDPVGVLNLAVRGGGPRVSASAPLFVASVPPSTRTLPLFVAAPPGTPGAIPLEGVVNLYCERGLQGVVPLICGGRSGEASAPLSIKGGDLPEASVPLALIGEGGVSQGETTLAIPSCSAFSPVAADVVLALPEVVGHALRTAPLSINGWRP